MQKDTIVPNVRIQRHLNFTTPEYWYFILDRNQRVDQKPKKVPVRVLGNGENMKL